jgi:hypothetical protein
VNRRDFAAKKRKEAQEKQFSPQIALMGTDDLDFLRASREEGSEVGANHG